MSKAQEKKRRESATSYKLNYYFSFELFGFAI